MSELDLCQSDEPPTRKTAPFTTALVIFFHLSHNESLALLPQTARNEFAYTEGGERLQSARA